MFKQVFLAVFATVLSVASVSAQEQGDMAVGGGLSLGTGDSFTNFGIGAKFQYNVTDPIRLEGAFTYFLKKDLVSMWDFSAYAQYLFPVAETITVYPIAGLGLLGTSASYGGYSASTSDFGFALGGGADFAITDNVFIYADLKYKIVDGWNRLLLSAGVAYKF
jgi:outer membrane protein X